MWFDYVGLFMSFLVTVIVCTHNPRHDYLREVLTALQNQTLSLEKWELILIDNISDNLLSNIIDLSWHPSARLIREEQLGLTFARLRGIREAKSELLVFVDDDNVLDFDYLKQALLISDSWPILGAWGGVIRGKFEVPPPEWAKPYLGALAIQEFQKDTWSNLPWGDTTPCGAGMCIRRVVAKRYATCVETDSLRVNLDRKGNNLSSSGDGDMAMVSYDMDFGTGKFVALKLTHLIPASRLTEDYFLRLLEAMEFSHWVLKGSRGILPQRPSCAREILDFMRLIRMDVRRRRFALARKRGLISAIKVFSKRQE